MTIFITTAYKSGWTNGAQHLVLATTDLVAAIDAAEHESHRLDQLFGVQVVAISENPMEAPVPKHYCPSSLGESMPFQNRQLEVFQELGTRVFFTIAHKSRGGPFRCIDSTQVIEQVDIPRWLAEEKKRAENKANPLYLFSLSSESATL
ncbi:MAG: hypothetical protein Q7S87_18205 [Agitococcus sp.]|nr:hypothetical protein [Agitococcus sp.]